MIRRPPRSTLSSSSAASDVYKRQSPGAATPAPRPRRRSRGCAIVEGADLVLRRGCETVRAKSRLAVGEFQRRVRARVHPRVQRASPPSGAWLLEPASVPGPATAGGGLRWGEHHTASFFDGVAVDWCVHEESNLEALLLGFEGAEIRLGESSTVLSPCPEFEDRAYAVPVLAVSSSTRVMSTD